MVARLVIVGFFGVSVCIEYYRHFKKSTEKINFNFCVCVFVCVSVRTLPPLLKQPFVYKFQK